MITTFTHGLGQTGDGLLDLAVTNYNVNSVSILYGQVWGGDVYVEERTVDVHVRRIRKALEPYARHKYIQTVRGAGYRFSTTL